jgi:hypothetical protein
MKEVDRRGAGGLFDPRNKSGEGAGAFPAIRFEQALAARMPLYYLQHKIRGVIYFRLWQACLSQ